MDLEVIFALVYILWIVAGAILVGKIIVSFATVEEDEDDEKLAKIMQDISDMKNREDEAIKAKEILDEIEDAAARGMYAIGGDGFLGDATKKELKKQGFKIKQFRDSEFNSRYLITWR